MLWAILILIAIAVIFGRDTAQSFIKVVGLLILLLVILVVGFAAMA